MLIKLYVCFYPNEYLFIIRAFERVEEIFNVASSEASAAECGQ
jgi:hypothetical protein